LEAKNKGNELLSENAGKTLSVDFVFFENLSLQNFKFMNPDAISYFEDNGNKVSNVVNLMSDCTKELPNLMDLRNLESVRNDP
jgi:hypothetical protein